MREKLQAIDLLLRVPLFACLGQPLLEVLAIRSLELTYPAEAYLFHEGQTPDGCFVIQSGLVIITKAKKRLAELGQGALVGEMGALDGLARSASAKALLDVTVLKIPRPLFLSVIHQSPAAEHRLRGKILARHMKNVRTVFSR